MSQCPICHSPMAYSFSATLLQKYQVSYYQCSHCGFLQTEEPYWLDEAYSEAIAVTDTGLIQRNLVIAAKLAALIYFELDPKQAYIDVAGGYGMLVRLMRDVGFDFYWDDKYCQNLFAKGFESNIENTHFNALTAFEVLEHVPNPFEFISEIMQKYGSRILVFSTLLYEGSLPPSDWWYYSYHTGQHISFFKLQTLQCIADRLELKLYSANGIHVLTDKTLCKWRFNLLTGRLSKLLPFYLRRKLNSLTLADQSIHVNKDTQL